jgi:NTE family protein
VDVTARWARFGAFAALACVLSSAIAGAEPPPAGERPQIGLVLGGGAARGLAHVGVLKWLDEHRVPVDVIAGTSIGGLIGGVYAAGLSADDLDRLVRSRDWNSLLSPVSDYRALPLHRKDDRRRYPGILSIGIREGIELPPGVSRGVFVGFLLSELSAAAPVGMAFDDLPTPFRCVATDLEHGEPVVLSQGNLSKALRATMAVPGVFRPIEIGESIFVDGGLVDNLPVTVAYDMGAEVIIAVDVPPPRHGRRGLRSLSGVLRQTSAIILERSEEASRRASDVLLTPDLFGYDPEDFAFTAAIADSGYAEAERAAAELLPYALDEEAYGRHLAKRRSRRGSSPDTIVSIEVTGLPEPTARRLEDRLASLFVGKRYDPARVAAALAGVDARLDVGNVHYATTRTSRGWGLLVDVTPSRIGPPFLDIGLGTRGSSEEALKIDVAARITLADPAGDRGLVELEGRLGSGFEIAGEWTHAVTRDAFVAPSVRLTQESPSLYVDGDLTAEAEVRTATFGFDAGTGFENSLRDARLGARWEIEETKREIGDVTGLDGTRRRFWLQGALRLDDLDHPSVPAKGFAVSVHGRWFPEVHDTQRSTTSVGARASWFVPSGTTDTWILEAEAGTAFRESLPLARRFTLGGPLRLPAFVTDELRGSRLLYGSIGYQKRLVRGMPIIGGALFGTVRYGLGGVGDTGTPTTAHHSGSIGLLMRTAFGPVIGTAGIGDDDHATMHLIAGAQFD